LHGQAALQIFPIVQLDLVDLSTTADSAHLPCLGSGMPYSKSSPALFQSCAIIMHVTRDDLWRYAISKSLFNEFVRKRPGGSAVDVSKLQSHCYTTTTLRGPCCISRISEPFLFCSMFKDTGYFSTYKSTHWRLAEVRPTPVINSVLCCSTCMNNMTEVLYLPSATQSMWEHRGTI